MARAMIATGSESEALEPYLHLSETIPGWTRGEEARELLQLSASLPDGAMLVEIGSFFGSGTILLAGARQVRGSGLVHCVDPFDGTGDVFSVPYYQHIVTQAGGGAVRDYFDANIGNAGLVHRVQVHQGRADEVARRWATPIDLLFLDGDQSPAGAREAYDAWVPFLKVGGIIAIHNSAPENHTPGHDGHRCVVEQKIVMPTYSCVRLVSSTTFAIKMF